MARTGYRGRPSLSPQSRGGGASHPRGGIGILIEAANLGLQRPASDGDHASFRLLFQHNPQPMWVYDCRTLRFLEVNDAALEDYGYSRDEFLSMRITDIRPAKDVRLFSRGLHGTRSRREWSGPWRHVLKNG